MENQKSWNTTQKLIHKALYSVEPITHGQSVVDELRFHDLMKPGVEVGNLAELINKKFDSSEKLLSSGFCGASSSTQIYHMLKQLGVVA